MTAANVIKLPKREPEPTLRFTEEAEVVRFPWPHRPLYGRMTWDQQVEMQKMYASPQPKRARKGRR